MSYQIEVQSDVIVSDDTFDILEETVSISLQEAGVISAEVTVLLTDDQRMRQLNQDFRGMDHSTDVLSFPSGEPITDAIVDSPYLGDIAISVPTAEQQARNNGHALASELQLLTIHGLLHLLGYDHLSPEEKEEMWFLQSKILDSLGIGQIKPTES